MATIDTTISQELENHRLAWCELIVHALKTHKEHSTNKEHSTKKNASLYDTYLDLMIRWYAQLDQNGEDSYSKFYASRVSKKALQKGDAKDVPVANKVNLILCANLKYSPAAMMELRKVHPEISYEHNPPVKYVRERLIELREKLEEEPKGITKNCVHTLLKDLIYSVVILTQAESDSLNGPKSFKETGSYEVRRARVYVNVNLEDWKEAIKQKKIAEFESELIGKLELIKDSIDSNWVPHPLLQFILDQTKSIKEILGEINNNKSKSELTGQLYYHDKISRNFKKTIGLKMKGEVIDYLQSIINQKHNHSNK
jgi:hypothetical protein